MKEIKTMTLGELRKELSAYPDNAVVYFGYGDLSFYRVKPRGENDRHGLLQIEFNEVYSLDEEEEAI